ncbi:SET domain-containing protein [Aquimarina longa]|uniref:SET domain-containing protein n=1 Tax=Aquimarina longa TaxID=1080221 RepID=UPI000784DFE4|nr:SET domain-containing protein-lysine N-methyltransferase [Aquimarina longa]
MYIIKDTEIKGYGVFTSKSFDKGETVLVGKIIEELESNHSHASQVAIDRFVFHNDIVRMVNHSCEPNCGIRVNESGAHDFIAIKNIDIDEEITFDYAMRNYSVEHFDHQCNCSSKECRGKITGWKDLPQNKKDEYVSWVAPYLIEIDSLQLQD